MIRLTQFSLFMMTMGLIMVQAATFIPLSFEQQVNESYGVIKGSYVSSVSKKLPTGEVVTESIFKVSEFSGIKNHEIINKNNFKILQPGGRWQGVMYHVDGSPVFEPQKEVVLLLSKTPHGFVPTNLGLGKYEIFKSAGISYLRSSVFPNHSRLGKIKLSDAMNSFKKYFGTNLQPVNHDKFVYKGNVKKKLPDSYTSQEGRIPASDDGVRTEQTGDYGIFAIIIIFALLGFFSAYSMRPHKKK